MINLYTINCPKCIVLEKKLDKAKIEYSKITDPDKIMEVSNQTGLRSAPILEVDGNFMKFEKAVEWLKNEGT